MAESIVTNKYSENANVIANCTMYLFTYCILLVSTYPFDKPIQRNEDCCVFVLKRII